MQTHCGCVQRGQLLRGARRESKTAGKLCGARGSLVAWADGLCTALQPHGFTTADVAVMLAREPRMLTSQPSATHSQFEALCTALLPPAEVGTAGGPEAVRRACVSAPPCLMSAGTVPELLESLAASGVVGNKDEAHAFLLRFPTAMTASPQRPWQVCAAVRAVGVAERRTADEAARACLQFGLSIETRLIPRLLWYEHCGGEIPYAEVGRGSALLPLPLPSLVHSVGITSVRVPQCFQARHCKQLTVHVRAEA